MASQGVSKPQIDQEGLMRLLKRHRLARGWTQTDLAKKIKVSAATISGWENGTFLPSAPMFPLLARLLEIDPMELTKIIDPPMASAPAVA